MKENIKNHSSYLTAADLMERFLITRATIFNLMKAGKFPRGIKIGHVYRWPLNDIENFEANGGSI